MKNIMKRLLSTSLILIVVMGLARVDIFATLSEHNHCICGKSNCSEQTHDTNPYWQPWSSNNSLPSEEGNYYLTQDVELTDTWTCTKNINLCLNGKTITGKDGKDVISVSSGFSLAITDCTSDSSNIGKITHKTNETGRGISNNGTLTLWNGSIANNTYKYQNGIGVNNNGTFTMNGGSITGNVGSDSRGGGNGGGVINSANCTFTMNGGSITDNENHYGGGVYNSGTFVMTGGSITENLCKYTDGGSGVMNLRATFQISGKVTIKDNKKRNEDNSVSEYDNNVSIYQNDDGLEVIGNLDSTSRVGITEKFVDTIVVKGSVDTTIFTSDLDDYEFEADNGNLKVIKAPHKHCICGGSTSVGDHTTHTSITWVEWNSDNSLPNDTGNYYLTKDVTLTDTWSCTKNINLCLNGKTITGANGKDVISVNNNSKLTITDCTSDSAKVGKITHETDETGRGIYIELNSILTIWKVNITGNKTNDKGGGVDNLGTFNMYSGSISNNTAESSGGVDNSGYAVFNMYGGSISGNIAKSAGGVGGNAHFNMYGGSISKNTANGTGTFEGDAGGVYNIGKFTMSGGSITENTATRYGGGIYHCTLDNDENKFMILSGNVNISGNVKGGTIVNGTLTGGTASNVVLHKNGPNYSKITIGTAGLNSSSKVGIASDAPEDYPTVVKNSVDTSIFTSDNDGYNLISNGNGGLRIVIGVEISGVKLLNTSNGIEMTNSTKVYDGECVSYSGGSYTPTSVTGVTLNYTWQKKGNDNKYSDINEAPSDAGTYRLVVNAIKDNIVIQTCNLPFTITPKELIASISASDKYYDGNTNANASITITGKIGEDEVSAKVSSASFDTNGVGTSKTVTANIILEGKDKDNYTISPTATTKANIFANNVSETKESNKSNNNVVVDKVAPVIEGVENNKTYCESITLTITDKNLKNVKLNGKTVTLTDGKLTLVPSNETQTVVATDKSGNSTSITVTINDGHTWSDWLSNGDDTHTRTCKYDSTHIETAKCHGGEATYEKKAVCDDCKAPYGDVLEKVADTDNSVDNTKTSQTSIIKSPIFWITSLVVGGGIIVFIIKRRNK